MPDRLITYLRMSGLVSIAELIDFFKVSPSTMTRRLGSYIEEKKVIRLGAGKNTKYAYLRNISGINQPVRVRQVDEIANILDTGNLWITHSGTILESKSAIIEYDDLPWFFSDLKPQGFIGRMIANNVSRKINVPAKSEHWSSDDLLRYLVNFSYDSSGNFELHSKFSGVKSFNANELTPTSRGEHYDNYVIDLAKSATLASSAGGEQPKLHSRFKEGDKHGICLVKYSPQININNPIALRVKDLLVCEHLALSILGRYNGHAATTKLLLSKERAYLEVQRFDRVVIDGKEAQIGMVSLETAIAEFVGYVDNWIEAGSELNALNLLSNNDMKLLNTWLAYSRFIGNSDTHNGNISLFLKDLTLAGLTPAYDMLPMLYMPTKGDIPDPEIRIKKPKNINEESWVIGRDLGLKFWGEVKAESRISPEFRENADKWITHINSM